MFQSACLKIHCRLSLSLLLLAALLLAGCGGGGGSRNNGNGGNDSGMSGKITTYVGTAEVFGGIGGQLSSPSGLACDATGNLYIADTNRNRVLKVKTDKTISIVDTNGYPLNFPSGLACDATGNLYIAKTNNGHVLKVDTKGTTNIYFDATNQPSALACDSSGNLYIVDADSIYVISKVPTEGETNDVYGGAKLTGANGVACDSANNVFYIAMSDSVSRVVEDNVNGGIVVTPCVNIVNAPGGKLSPTALAFDSLSRVLYIADAYNRVLKVDVVTTKITTYAGTGAGGFGGDGGLAINARLNNPKGLAVDKYGNLYIADTENHCIRKVWK